MSDTVLRVMGDTGVWEPKLELLVGRARAQACSVWARCGVFLSFLFLTPGLGFAEINDKSKNAERGTGAGSLKLLRHADVFAEPSQRSQRIGTVPRGSRVNAHEILSTRGCQYGWRRIEPAGFICTKTSASKLPPSTEELPVLQPGRALPGAYGRLSKSEAVLLYRQRADIEAGVGTRPERKMDMLLKKRLRIAGKRFWKIASGYYVEAVHVLEFGESPFVGKTLGDAGLPMAWARPIEKDAPVKVRALPTESAEVVDELRPKTAVPVLEVNEHGNFVRIGEGRWIERRETRIASKIAPPPDIVANEVWVDIDVDEQVLTVYRGEHPIYATMVSTGTRKRRTPLGSFRITQKVATQSMFNTANSEDQYRVAEVPWIMYFSKVYALHGTYWHDRFGARRSHGCINLSPRDAKNVYELTGPAVPPGWSSAIATDTSPGSLIRIRGRRKR